MELKEAFSQEVNRFQSLLFANNLYNILDIQRIESYEDQGKFKEFSVFTVYTKNLIFGIKVEIKDKNVYTTCWINEENIGYDVSERSELCSLLTKFYDYLILN